jgi:hypothetical protein
MRHKPWAVLTLVPLLLSGCSALGLDSAPSPGGGSSAAASPGPSWIVVAQGSATPSPGPSYPAATATPSAATGLPGGGAPTPTGTPTATCSPNTFNFSKISVAGVTAGTTSAAVSWYNVGGYHLVQFRLTAISQDLKGGPQRDIGWVTVKPTMPCGQMNATITGLDRQTAYVFSVDAVVLRRSGDGTHAATVARSGVTYTG